MVAPISSSTVSNWSDSLFNKLDTKKQGYVDQSDLAAALGTDETGSATNSDDAAAMLKQIDGDGDGKITRSELSTAISKVADELNAQFDSSRVGNSQASASGATADAANDDNDNDNDDTSVVATGAAGNAGAPRGTQPAGGGGGAPAASSSTEVTNKYSSEADTDSNGTVSDDEAAAYKKLMAAEAEKSQGAQGAHGSHGAHGAKGGDKADGTDGADSTDSDKELARALDMLKQYVNNSSDSTTQATSTISESA